jgi:glycosyltransferase involved in cell wall biosynthesis
MISIIIPAHNEGSVIARTLFGMTDGAAPGELDITVVCNGCTDDTAAVARKSGAPVRVIETEVASKIHALNLGDQAALGFPRIYIDADVVLTLQAIGALASRLEHGDVLAVAPTPYFELAGCSLLVKAFYSVRSYLPSAREGIGGSGVYGLSKAGRSRFDKFPRIVADDLYVRVQFKPEERETLSTVTSTVFAPRKIKDLIAIRARVYYGNFELARLFPDLWKNRGASNDKALVQLLKRPALWMKTLVYYYVIMRARNQAQSRIKNSNFVWARDSTSRSAQ